VVTELLGRVFTNPVIKPSAKCLCVLRVTSTSYLSGRI
jgi:hypothetical protein